MGRRSRCRSLTSGRMTNGPNGTTNGPNGTTNGPTFGARGADAATASAAPAEASCSMQHSGFLVSKQQEEGSPEVLYQLLAKEAKGYHPDVFPNEQDVKYAKEAILRVEAAMITQLAITFADSASSSDRRSG